MKDGISSSSGTGSALRVWTVSEAKAGTLTQCVGVAQHLDPEPHSVIIDRKLRFWEIGLLSPYKNLARPEPDVIVACGSMAPEHVFSILAHLSKRPLVVYLQPPPPEIEDRFDLIFSPEHDWLPEFSSRGQYRRITGAPHKLNREELAAIREDARKKWSENNGRVVTVLIGGPTEAYGYDVEIMERLVGELSRFAIQGYTVLVSPSRRTPKEIVTGLAAWENSRIKVWDRQGENPYLEFLSAADVFVVTEDSVTMVCEALATGHPTYVFPLARIESKKLEKFQRFHHDMSHVRKLTRDYQSDLESYDYEVLDESRRISGIIRDEVEKRNRRG